MLGAPAPTEWGTGYLLAPNVPTQTVREGSAHLFCGTHHPDLDNLDLTPIPLAPEALSEAGQPAWGLVSEAHLSPKFPRMPTR